LMGLRVRIPSEAWIFDCCECCVLSGGGLCVGFNTRPADFYRVRCVQWVCSRSSVSGEHDPESGHVLCPLPSKKIVTRKKSVLALPRQGRPGISCRQNTLP